MIGRKDKWFSLLHEILVLSHCTVHRLRTTASFGILIHPFELIVDVQLDLDSRQLSNLSQPKRRARTQAEKLRLSTSASFQSASLTELSSFLCDASLRYVRGR